MTATLMVPVDGSDKDARALAVAAGLAYLTDGAVHLVRVHDPTAGAHAPSRPDVEGAVRAQAEHLGSELPTPVTWEVAESAEVANFLLERAAALDATLVVMATRASGPVGRAVHGSVADRVVREASRPIVLVPPGADFLRGKHVHMRRMLVPLDGSEVALQVLDHLLRFSRAHELELVLAQVVPPLHIDNPLEADDVASRLEAVASGLSDRVARTEVCVEEGEDAAETIVDLVREEFADLIAMTTRGAGGMNRLVFGSVAAGVVRRSEVSVLLVTPV